MSLCFDEFELITCNLVNYRDYYNQKSDSKDDEFEHTFIVVDLKGKRCIIDTTWGMITDYDTYKYIFDIDNIRSISSKDIKNTEIYQYIEKRKNYIGPSYESKLHEDETYKGYISMMDRYMDLCKSYVNPNNKHLQDFINRCLYETSNVRRLEDLRVSKQFKVLIGCRIEYPTVDLFSLTNDEFDLTLESPLEDTKETNARVLESYHKEKIPPKMSIKQKLLELVRKII